MPAKMRTVAYFAFIMVTTKTNAWSQKFRGNELKIVVASRNPVKVAAVEEAFKSQYTGMEIELLALGVESGVSDQPMTDGETRQGAMNRAENARKAAPDADFWVGLEGGLEQFDNGLLAFAWMAIMDSNRVISTSRSATLPLPPGVQELIANGLELGEANDRIFSTVNSKQAGGAYGLLTEGRFTRESIYTQTLILALVPFVNSLWNQ
jgi:inosine/xanthosine triphosphatase